MNEKIAITELFPEEIVEQLNISQSFRGKQIFEWIGKGVETFDEMTNISSEMRTELTEKAELRTSSVTTEL